MKKGRSALLAACMAFVFAFTCILTSCRSESVSQESIQAFNKSEELWYQYKPGEAKTNLEEILKEDPGYSDANRKMAFIEYYYYQNYDKALEYIQKAIEVQPKNAENQITEGDIYFAYGQYENAIKSYEKALELDSKNTDIYYSMAQTYSKLNKKDEAKSVLEKGYSINPVYVGINTALHQQYIEDEEYEKAYDVWKHGNASNVEPIGYLGKWNELYRDAARNKSSDRHFQFGNLYAELLLYDEAKLEFERALKDDPNNNEINRKLNEISLFVKFRDELKECFNNYYRRRILNGIKEDINLRIDVENIYKQMQSLFPEVEYETLSFSSWVSYKLNNEIQKKFNVIINCFPVDDFMGCYFGYVVGDSYEEISHWGKKLDMRVTIIKNAVINPFWTWYHRIDGLGGWSSTVKDDNNEIRYENKIALDSKFEMAYDLWEAAVNKEKRNDMIAKAEERDKDLINKPSPEVFYSSLLSMQFSLKAMDQLIEEAKTKFGSEDEVKAYVLNHLVYDVFVPLTYLHEGQHALDAKYHNFAGWELEYRAMMSEPVYGEMQLQDITSMLHPDIGDKSTNYGKAHTKIFSDIVNYINDHSKDYPFIDTSKNIMMQLSKLSGEDLKEIAKNVYEINYPGERYE